MMPKELREKSESELKTLQKQLRTNLFHLKIKKKTGQLEKVHTIAAAKAEFARVLTIANEKKSQKKL